MKNFVANENKLGLMNSVKDVFSALIVPAIIIGLAFLVVMPRPRFGIKDVKDICTNWKAVGPNRIIKDGKEVVLSRYTCQTDNGFVYQIEEE